MRRPFLGSLLLLFLATSCATPPPPAPLPPLGIEASSRLFQEGKDLLRPVEEFLGPTEPHEVGFGILPQWAIDNLNAAYRRFHDSLYAAPGAPWAAEAFYLAGRCQDFPYLQQFHIAVEDYRQAMERFPGSEFGEKAGERYRNLTSKMKGLEGGHNLP